MIRSMTGFGKCTRAFNGSMLSVELASVNHRYLDCSIRLPHEWAVIEGSVRKMLSERLSRGKVSVTVNLRRGTRKALLVRFDADLARQYVDASQELCKMLGSGQTLPPEALALFDGVFYQEEDEVDLDAARAAVAETLGEAIQQLDGMRGAEGETLAADIRSRLELLRTSLEVIEARLPELTKLYESRLRTRIDELVGTTDIAEERIVLEVAVMADKGDVTEEVVRLKSHLDHGLELLDAEEPVGRKLNFLAQEIQREINTLGSKVRETGVIRDVLEMKSELEKIREQLQNIE